MQSRPIRRSGQPTCAGASSNAGFWPGPDPRRALWPAVTSTAQIGRTHGCTDQPADVKKSLANSEPSTHGTKRTYRDDPLFVRFRGEADIRRWLPANVLDATDPFLTSVRPRSSAGKLANGCRSAALERRTSAHVGLGTATHLGAEGVHESRRGAVAELHRRAGYVQAPAQQFNGLEQP